VGVEAALGSARLGWFGLGWFGFGWVGLVWVGLVWFGLVARLTAWFPKPCFFLSSLYYPFKSLKPLKATPNANPNRPSTQTHPPTQTNQPLLQVGSHTPNFNRMEGNPLCKQIDWDKNTELLAAWKEGRTGYPWIDAIMSQVGSGRGVGRGG